jgi:3,5-dihydroxyphenylacetyl-CoA synthase
VSTVYTSGQSLPVAAWPRLVGVGTANPSTYYTQRELLDLVPMRDKRIRSLFLNGSIEGRYLVLPPPAPDGGLARETQGQLLRKHRVEGTALAATALAACLKKAGRSLDDVRYLCCVSSTGWLTPGLSTLVADQLGLGHGCGRLDVVGMGCNAGLNGLNAIASWSALHPGELAVLICVEVCSAAYVFDGSMRTAVVNSLFGDGAAAVAVMSACDADAGPAVRRFESYLIPDSVPAMRYDWDDTHGKFSFSIDPEVPYVVGAHVEAVVDRLLAATGIRRSQVAHWLVHSGGKKVIDAVKVNLGLTEHDLRHTRDVLRAVTLANRHCLNAEDDALVRDLETAVDLVLLDEQIRVCVLRGAEMTHPRYAGRRVFSAGINLTDLYRGQISFVAFLLGRELGPLNKILRGVRVDDEPGPQCGVAKPWIGVVDGFAIGGGVQVLLTLDRVVAEDRAYFRLPAAQEGIVPGAANLRLTRMVGARPARALLSGRALPAGSPDARYLCDDVVPGDDVHKAVERAVSELDSAAAVSNRHLLHLAEEPVDLFREYMALFSWEQSRRMYDGDVLANLERTWMSRPRD